MKKVNEININTQSYWDDIYSTPEKLREYEESQTNSTIDDVETERFRTVLDFIPDNSKFLDIGCGVGVLTGLVKLVKPTCEVWGTDISQKVINATQNKQPFNHLFKQVIGDTSKVPNDFDVVFSGEVVEHLDDPEQLFKDTYGVLKQGGKFILTCPNRNMIISPEHIWEFNHDDIRKLYEDNGFTRVEFVYLPNNEDKFVIFAVGKKL